METKKDRINKIPKNLELYEKNGHRFLRMDIETENEFGYYITHVENIEFDVRVGYIHTKTNNSYDSSNVSSRTCTVDLDIGNELKVKENEDGTLPIEQRLIKEKFHNLTVSEIEEKLGYKVNIVS